MAGFGGLTNSSAIGTRWQSGCSWPACKIHVKSCHCDIRTRRGNSTVLTVRSETCCVEALREEMRGHEGNSSSRKQETAFLCALRESGVRSTGG